MTMEKTGLKKPISHNKFSPASYVKLFTALEIIAGFLYVRYGATFSVHGNNLRILIALAVILGVGNLALSIKRERNWISLVAGVCIPVFAYEASVMCKYSDTLQRITVIGTTVSLIAAALLAWGKAIGLKNPRLRRSVWISKCAHLTRILCFVLLFAVCIYGKAMVNSHHTVSIADIEYLLSDTQNDIPDYANSLSANIATVAKMDPDGGWAVLTTEEKMDVLETICRIECRFLGMRDSAPCLELAYLEDGLLGQYDHKEDKITLSYNYIIDTNVSAYSICQVLCHEMYHRYQRYQINMLEAIRNNDATAKYADLLLLDSVSIYEEELNHYVSPIEGSELSYYLYHSQRLEHDAEKFGNEAVYQYYEKIQDYLKNG